METKSIEQIKEEVAHDDNFQCWQILFESCAMYDYGRLEKAITEIAIRYAKQSQAHTDTLMTEIKVLRERVEELELCLAESQKYMPYKLDIRRKIESLINKSK